MRDTAGFEASKPWPSRNPHRSCASLGSFSILTLACWPASLRPDPSHTRRVRCTEDVRHQARTGYQPRHSVGRLHNRRFEPFDRSIDVLVGRLRKKIEADPKQPRLIVTVPGEGYRFDGLTQSLSSEQKPSIDVQAPQDDDGRPSGTLRATPR